MPTNRVGKFRFWQITRDIRAPVAIQLAPSVSSSAGPLVRISARSGWLLDSLADSLTGNPPTQGLCPRAYGSCGAQRTGAAPLRPGSWICVGVGQPRPRYISRLYYLRNCIPSRSATRELRRRPLFADRSTKRNRKNAGYLRNWPGEMSRLKAYSRIC